MTGWLVLFLIIVGGYVISLMLNPWVQCSKCHGKPKSQGWLYSYAHHICSKCGGSGQQPRLGLKLFPGMRQP
jgi:DnaJ-class molecular chaperone